MVCQTVSTRSASASNLSGWRQTAGNTDSRNGIAKFDASKVSKLTLAELMDAHVYHTEMALEACRRNNVETFIVIDDMSGLSMFAATKQGLDVFRAQGALDTAHYPLVVSAVNVINATTAFTVVWPVVKLFSEKSVLAVTQKFGTADWKAVLGPTI